MANPTQCPFCGEELQIRYYEFSEEILGMYCEDCNKFRYDDEWRFSEEPEWITGIEGEEYPWYGTN